MNPLRELANNEAIKNCIGKRITEIKYAKDIDCQDFLKIKFKGGAELVLTDDNVEYGVERNSYMEIEDDLSFYKHSKLLGVTVKYEDAIEDDDGQVRSAAFIDIITTKGTFDISFRCVHNGCYSNIEPHFEES